MKEVELISITQIFIKTNIKVPQLSGMLDTKYQEQTNDIILSLANRDLANWEKEAAEAAADAKKNGFISVNRNPSASYVHLSAHG